MSTHGFMVRYMYSNDRAIVKRFAQPFMSYEMQWSAIRKKLVKSEGKKYYIDMDKYNLAGFLRSPLDGFLDALKMENVPDNAIEIYLAEKVLKSSGANLILREGVSPKEEQIPIIEFVLLEKDIRVLPIQMGKGKTFISLYAVYTSKMRTSVTCAAIHVQTWLNDANKFFVNGEDETLVVRGRKQFVALIEAAKKGILNKSIIIFTVKTMRDYLTEYENLGRSTYGVSPGELYKLIGVRQRIVDEAHTDLHFNYRHTILTNCNKVIYLSATLDSNSSFINKLYMEIYPLNARYTELAWDIYVDVMAIGYVLKEPRLVKCNGHRGYSHIAYENWILSDKGRTKSYLDIILKIVEEGFLKMYRPGMKLLIFASSIEMCEIVADYLSINITDENGITVHDFTESHQDEILYNNDIIVSTPKKAGTGRDIKGLVMVLSTVAMLAKETNIQKLGRLRKPGEEFSDIVPKYIYLVCISIPKHLVYHEEKIKAFKPLVNEIKTARIPILV